MLGHMRLSATAQCPDNRLSIFAESTVGGNNMTGQALHAPLMDHSQNFAAAQNRGYWIR